MSKYLVTLSASTGAGQITQCASTTATINGKPIAVVGDIATHPLGPDTLIEGVPTRVWYLFHSTIRDRSCAGSFLVTKSK